MSSFDLDRFLPYRLATTAARVSEEFSQVYRQKFGLSVTEWRIIAHLDQTEDPVSIRDLCSRVETEKSKVSRAVSRLEDRRLLKKRTNADDKRLLVLSLTSSGKDLMAEIAPLARAYDAELEKRLGHSKDTLLSALETVFQSKD